MTGYDDAPVIGYRAVCDGRHRWTDWLIPNRWRIRTALGVYVAADGRSATVASVGAAHAAGIHQRRWPSHTPVMIPMRPGGSL